MYKSRNITKKISAEELFFEEITGFKCTNLNVCISTSSEDIEINKELGFENTFHVNIDQSSSSSISWTDDNEADCTSLIQDEYERMGRVLQGIESIPSCYDYQEYQLWIKTFPCLSITGKMLISPLKHKKNTNLQETYQVECCDEAVDCTIFNSIENKILKNKVKDHLTERLFNSVCERLFKGYDQKKSGLNDSKTEFNVDCQEISQIEYLHVEFENTFHSNNKLSPTQVPDKYESATLPRHISNSKWLQDESLPLEYSSLPYFPAQKTASSVEIATSTKCEDIKYKARTSSKITLPPIKNSQYIIKDQYRSISATPRSQNKLSGTASVQLSFVRNRKVQLPKSSNIELKKFYLSCEFPIKDK